MVADERVRAFALLTNGNRSHSSSSFGATLKSYFTLKIKTLLYLSLPPAFSQGFKSLIMSALSQDGSTIERPPPQDQKLWSALDLLGQLDRYDSVFSGCGRELTEKHVLETGNGEWSRLMLEESRTWMSDKMVM